MNNPMSTQAFPIEFGAMPPVPGYSAALQHFHELREMLKDRAYNLDKGLSVTVKLKMMTHLPGRVKPSIVSVSADDEHATGTVLTMPTISQNICDTVGNVPAHIGVWDLKKICFATLLPRFLKWSKDYPLTITDVSLRKKDWMELSPPAQGPDTDAVWDSFVTETKKQKGPGTKKFSPGNGIDLILGIEHEVFELALESSLQVPDTTTVLLVSGLTNINVLISILRRLRKVSSQMSVPTLPSPRKDQSLVVAPSESSP